LSDSSSSDSSDNGENDSELDEIVGAIELEGDQSSEEL